MERRLFLHVIPTCYTYTVTVSTVVVCVLNWKFREIYTYFWDFRKSQFPIIIKQISQIFKTFLYIHSHFTSIRSFYYEHNGVIIDDLVVFRFLYITQFIFKNFCNVTKIKRNIPGKSCKPIINLAKKPLNIRKFVRSCT